MNDSQVSSISPVYSKLQYLTKILHPLRPPNFLQPLRRNTCHIFGKFSAIESISLPYLWFCGRRVGIRITCSNKCNKLWHLLCSEEHILTLPQSVCSSWDAILMETDQPKQPTSTFLTDGPCPQICHFCCISRMHVTWGSWGYEAPIVSSSSTWTFYFWNQRHFRH